MPARSPIRGRALTAALLTGSLLLAACSSDGDPASTPAEAATTTTADATGASGPWDGEWPVEDPDDRSISDEALEEVRSYAFADGRNTQGLVIVHDGAIVAEWYADDADADSWAASWSVAKSFTSALVGIAVEEGAIPSLDEPMTTWYPDWADRGLGDVTLRDVLQMAPGLEWNENYDPGGGTSDIIRMVLTERDQLAYAAARPKNAEPGTEFLYSSGTTMLLSGVLEQATGMPADEYAQEKLFDPLGMTKAEWWRDAAGHTLTYCCLDTTSRDFARFGQLFLDGGRWGDEQLVPEDYVEASVEGAPASPDFYGLQWWLDDVDGVPTDLFSANGHNGQYIYVIPSLDLVVVRNGTYVKHDGPPIADPNLFTLYPSDGFIEGKGTVPPDEWDDGRILQPLAEDLGG